MFYEFTLLGFDLFVYFICFLASLVHLLTFMV
jgi:hypothetical protein